MELLQKEEIVQIVDASRKILEETGVKIYSEKARKLLTLQRNLFLTSMVL